MNNSVFAIIEIGSSNTKTHVYDNGKVIYNGVMTIEFKKNYAIDKKIVKDDLNKLYEIIEEVLEYTKNIYIFGCSIFRLISDDELKEINDTLSEKYGLKIRVVSQEEEALYTAYGCYNDIEYNGNIGIFIGDGGSVELIVVNNKEIVEKKYLNFGVVDITNKFETLKDDIAKCSFEEVTSYIDSLIGDLEIKCDVLILAGGDHPFWYNSAHYKLKENILYNNDKQKYMLGIRTSDKYDRDCLKISLDEIKNNSNNPLWFNGARAMKMLTNVIAHRVHAKYIVPTNINMEDGLVDKIANKEIGQ